MTPTPPELIQLTRRPKAGAPDAGRWFCQATEIPAASSPLPWWEPVQYVRDVRSGNVGDLEAIVGIGRYLFGEVPAEGPRARNSAVRPWPPGPHPEGRPGSQARRPCRVKTRDEIEADARPQQPESRPAVRLGDAPVLGREFVVRRRVERIIDEPSWADARAPERLRDARGRHVLGTLPSLLPATDIPLLARGLVDRAYPNPTNEASVPGPRSSRASEALSHGSPAARPNDPPLRSCARVAVSDSDRQRWPACRSGR